MPCPTGSHHVDDPKQAAGSVCVPSVNKYPHHPPAHLDRLARARSPHAHKLSLAVVEGDGVQVVCKHCGSREERGAGDSELVSVKAATVAEAVTTIHRVARSSPKQTNKQAACPPSCLPQPPSGTANYMNTISENAPLTGDATGWPPVLWWQLERQEGGIQL